MEEQIIVKPTYTGPRLIEAFLKKAKSHSSLGRMISTYNKRFFVLDMNRLLFYYLPERDSVLANATEIPLDSINRIYVEHQANLGPTDLNAKQSFVILTKKKVYKLLCDSQLILEQILFAFSNLIGAQSQKPLYDWNTYHSPQSQDDNTPTNQQEKPTHRRSSSKGPSPLNRMDYQQPMMMPQQNMNISQGVPQQTMSKSQGMPHQNPNMSQGVPQQNMSRSQGMPQQNSNMSQGPVRVIYTTEQQQTALSPSEREPKAQSKEIEEVQKSESEQPIQNQTSPKADEAESKTFQEKANSEVEQPSPSEIESSSSPTQSEKERKSASKENHQQQVRGRNMGQGVNLNQIHNPDQVVEVQSLDMPSKMNSEETKSIPLSSRQLQSFRRSSVSRQKATGLTPRNVGIPISKVENVNAAPLKFGQDLTPNKVIKVSEDNVTSQFEAAVNRATRDNSSPMNDLNAVPSRPSQVDNNYRSSLRAASNRPSRGGAESYGFSVKDEPRVEEKLGQDMPLSYLDIMKQKKKEQQNMPQETPSSKYEARRQLDTEDDWDKDLFGDGQLSPIRTQKKLDQNSLGSYNSQYISQPDQSSAQISKLTGMNERKIVTSIKEKTESFAPQKYVHNDWDDDL